MASKPLEYYVDRYQQGTLTPDEAIVFRNMLEQPEHRHALEQLLDAELKAWETSDMDFPNVVQRVQQRVAQDINKEQRITPVHRIHLLRTAWFRYAAAVLVLIGTGVIFWFGNQKETADKQVASNEAVSDILPQRGAAVLTLADGRTIVLDSVANGNLASQGGAHIVKLDNGQLQYVADSAAANGEALYNTISTPAGTQYQLTLSDGTKVWLNAASSITYPAVFTGKQRTVKVTGEAYFEVAKNKDRPFVAEVDGKFSIQVLGTAFNVKAYRNESNFKTTLLEGSVQVTNHTGDANPAAGQTVKLQPGEQAQVNHTGSIAVVKNVDQEKVMAWKNGLFNFNNASLDEVMREIARWYDIEVVYEQQPPHLEFVGKISRDLSLSQVLNGLKGTGFNFRITEERKLIIAP
jgi:Fe2+-dicitrate sensor, membrane component